MTTITASTTIGISLSSPSYANPVVIDPGITVSGTVAGVYAGSGSWTIRNAGSVAGTGSYGYGVKLASGGSVTNASSAAITGGYRGVAILGGAGTVVNDGGISSTGSSGRGVYLESVGSVTNAASASVAGSYIGVDLAAGGSVVNATSASITSGYRGVAILGGAGTVINHGSIVGTGTGGAGVAPSGEGIYLGFGGSVTNAASASIAGGYIGVKTGGAGTVVNAGTIAGTSLYSYGYGVALAGGFVTNAASASITGGQGGVVIAGAAGSVVNDGGIVGTGTASDGIRLLSGSVTNAASASIAGGYRGIVIYGGAGTVVNGGSIAGNASAAPGAGVVLGVGGSVTNQSTGIISGNGGIYGYNAGLTVVNAGTIGGTAYAVRFATGQTDRLTIDPGALFLGTVTGGNTIGSTIVSTLELASRAASGTLSGLATQYIDFAQVTIESGASWTLAGTNSNATGATLTNSGTLTIASYLANSGSIAGGVILAGGASLTNPAGVIDNPSGAAVYSTGAGVSVNNAATMAGAGVNGFGVALLAGGLVSNAGTGTIDSSQGSGISIAGGAGTVINAGSIAGGGADAVLFAGGFPDLLVADPGAVFAGTVDGGNTIGATIVSTLELASAASAGTLSGLGTQVIDFARITIDAGASWTLNGTIVSGETLAFAGPGAYLHLDNPGGVAGTITNFDIGETIDLKGVNPASVIYSGGTLSFGGGSFPLSLASAGKVTAATSGDGAAISVVACFAAGTRIATPHGGVAVELLREGGTVLTASGGRQKIRWIGHRRVDCRRHPDPTRVLPIRIAPHAFGEGRPRRPLLLSPDHAVFVEDVLIPIRFLLNASTVARIELDTVSYYHIELARHDVVLADGMPAESYLDTGDRGSFANGGEAVRLFADFPARRWEAHGCAPLIVTGPKLTAARALAAGRATPVKRSRRAA